MCVMPRPCGCCATPPPPAALRLRSVSVVVVAVAMVVAHRVEGARCGVCRMAKIFESKIDIVLSKPYKTQQLFAILRAARDCTSFGCVCVCGPFVVRLWFGKHRRCLHPLPDTLPIPVSACRRVGGSALCATAEG